MKVTAADLLMGGWHCGWYWEGVKSIKIWAFGTNPTRESGLSFHEAVKLYKQGVKA